MEVAHGEARPLRPISSRCIVPCSNSRRYPVAHVRSRNLAVSFSGADADPPRHMAGGASLGRSRPLASIVVSPGTAVFGSDAERQLPAPCTGLRRSTAGSPGKTKLPLGDAGYAATSMSETRSIVSCRGACANPRSCSAVALIPLSKSSHTRSRRFLSGPRRLPCERCCGDRSVSVRFGR